MKDLFRVSSSKAAHGVFDAFSEFIFVVGVTMLTGTLIFIIFTAH